VLSAIQRYQEIADFTNGKDHNTHQMAVTMLNEEIEHENDIEDWLTDIQRMKVFNVMTGSSVLKNYRKIKWKLFWARSKREIYTQKREKDCCSSFL